MYELTLNYMDTQKRQTTRDEFKKYKTFILLNTQK